MDRYEVLFGTSFSLGEGMSINLVDIVLKGVQVVFGLIPAVDGFIRAFFRDTNSTDGKVDAVAQTAFGLVQLANTACQVATNSSTVKLSTQIGAGVFDVTRRVTQLRADKIPVENHVSTLVTLGSCHAIGVAGSFIDRYPQICCGHEEGVRRSLRLATTALSTFTYREDISHLVKTVREVIRRLRHATPDDRITPAQLREAAAQIRQGNSLSVNDRILLTGVPIFNSFICAIRGLPISEVAVVNRENAIANTESINRAFPIYEKTAIEQWIREKPQELPPGWPVDLMPLPLQANYIRPSVDLQGILNSKWNDFANVLDSEAEGVDHPETQSASRPQQTGSNDIRQ
jgi:hypothetical protein